MESSNDETRRIPSYVMVSASSPQLSLREEQLQAFPPVCEGTDPSPLEVKTENQIQFLAAIKAVEASLEKLGWIPAPNEEGWRSVLRQPSLKPGYYNISVEWIVNAAKGRSVAEARLDVAKMQLTAQGICFNRIDIRPLVENLPLELPLEIDPLPRAGVQLLSARHKLKLPKRELFQVLPFLCEETYPPIQIGRRTKDEIRALLDDINNLQELWGDRPVLLTVKACRIRPDHCQVLIIWIVNTTGGVSIAERQAAWKRMRRRIRGFLWTPLRVKQANYPAL